MNPKIIPALVNALISFVLLVTLSYFMNKWINSSEQSFVEFFTERWHILLLFSVVYTAYKMYIKNRKLK